ncbi:MAG: FadR family transcriptional regulator [Ideonella sp.]|nr:FadR family transcriptional regulator [Ideonella sp.]MCC7455806.1 FadR family transcriptional regulator [Nitrospira sp.]
MLTRRHRPLAHELADTLSERIAAGELAPGARLPTEAAFMDEYGVSRTVVREALSKLQQTGAVHTRHGVGTFVVGPPEAGAGFRVSARHLATLRDVVAVLELRIGIETEAAALAAQRRDDTHLRSLRAALAEFAQALEQGHDAVAADLRFHREIARATGNLHFGRLLATLGPKIIPRARLGADAEPQTAAERGAYLRRVNAEHESIYDAIAAGDADAARAAMRTHLANARERRRRAMDPPAAGAAAARFAPPAARSRIRVVR